LLVSYRWEPQWKAPFSRLQFSSATENCIEILMYGIDWEVTKKKIEIKDNDMCKEVLSVLQPRLSSNIGVNHETIITQDLVAPTKSGWLTKSGAHSNDSWKKRWFVLENGEINYYTSDKQKEPQGTILVNGSKIVQVEIQKKKYIFSVVTKNRTYHIQSQNEHEKQSWISACIQHGGIYSD